MKIFSSVTVNICWGMVLHFSRLYISLVVMGGKMYNPEKCLNLCNQMLTVIQSLGKCWRVRAYGLPRLVFRTKTGLEAASYPFRYYYTTKLLKVACSVF